MTLFRCHNTTTVSLLQHDVVTVLIHHSTSAFLRHHVVTYLCILSNAFSTILTGTPIQQNKLVFNLHKNLQKCTQAPNATKPGIQTTQLYIITASFIHLLMYGIITY